ncbi:MAG: non-hydrolyzing UDP-N-acetylglucosamine 2-epimerase [Haloarcula sp.]
MVSSVAFVLGTRPEIIKLAPVIRACKDKDLEYTVIHTGQHYSEYLDNVFFEDLELGSPDHNLAVGSGSHAEQTGEMMAGIDRKLDEEQPDAVLVQGDTNSALAGGLVASKRDGVLGHVEAGLRSYNRDMPEELNRILIDHVAERLFVPTADAAECLTEEGIPDHRIEVTGNTIVDAVTQNAALAAEKSTILDDLSLEEGQFSLMTAHRPGNVDDRERFEGLLQGIARYAEFTDTPVIFPVHPRSDEKLSEYDLTVPDPIVCVDPLNFLDFLNLENKAQIVFTDSGGVQEETCILGTPCVTIREHTERPETLSVGSNVLAEPTPDAIVGSAFDIRSNASDWEAPFGDGDAAEKILATLTQSASEPTEKVYT